MSSSFLSKILVAALAATGAAGGAAAEDLSGVWMLNVEKSNWQRMRAPASVDLRIEQAGNVICYEGLVTYTNEDSRQFSFEGAIDGKEYPAVRSYGSGKLMLRRRDNATLESVFSSADGLYVETSRMVLSPDGKRITRYMRVRTPDGTRTWVEVYERRTG